MLVTTTIETKSLLLNYFNKVIDIINVVKPFLNLTTELRVDCYYIQYRFKYTSAAEHIKEGIPW